MAGKISLSTDLVKDASIMRSTPLHTKVLALVGITALVLQLSAVPFEAFLFHLNQDYIARHLCEHKTPNCNGHCFLMKQMAKSSNASKDKNTERTGGQLDGHFLVSALNSLTLFPAPATYLALSSEPAVAGWRSTLLQPPRIG